MLQGRVCLITGGNRGIGLATAAALADRGATVVITSRDPERGEAAAGALREASGNPQVHSVPCDFEYGASVRAMVDTVLERHPRLDVLINNHATTASELRLTEEGVESTFAINHLGYFRTSLWLLPRLQAIGSARIVNVASKAHVLGRLDLDDLACRREFSSTTVYRRSKLANVLFTYELARRLEGTGVTANCLHPGVIYTGLLAGAIRRRWYLRPFAGVARWLVPGPEAGARTSVHLATSPAVEGVSGRYFWRSRPSLSSPASRDKDLARRLWEVSCDLTGIEAQGRILVQRKPS